MKRDLYDVRARVAHVGEDVVLDATDLGLCAQALEQARLADEALVVRHALERPPHL